MAVDYSNEPIHVGVYAEQRRGTVLMCDHDRVLPHWLTITSGELGQVTCHACLRLVQEGEEALAEMQRIRNHESVLNDILHTHFRFTGETRTITEYRDRDGAQWYQLAPEEIPSPSVVAVRQVVQRQIEQINPDGTTCTYWETQS